MTDGLSARARGALPVDPSWIALPAGVLVAGAVLQFAPLSPDAARMLAITLFCVAMWIGSPVDPWFTALIGIGLIGVGFSAELALTGFQSPATWLVVVGLLVGEAATASGLAGLVERTSLHRMPDRIATDAVAVYRYLLVVLSVGSLALAVLVPSSLVRVLILAPILKSLGDLFTERSAKIGIFLGPLFATYYGASGVLTGSLANIIGRQAGEKGVAFSKAVSLGNEADLQSADFFAYFAQDPETRVIGGYIEGVKDGPYFLESLKAAAEQKPVVLWRVGLTAEGGRAAASHTGALAGSENA